MGKLTIEKWQCDRCRTVFDEQPKRDNGSWGSAPTYYSIRASEDHGVAGGVIMDWREMCHPCQRAVGKEIAAMRASALEARTPTPPATED